MNETEPKDLNLKLSAEYAAKLARIRRHLNRPSVQPTQQIRDLIDEELARCASDMRLREESDGN